MNHQYPDQGRESSTSHLLLPCASRLRLLPKRALIKAPRLEGFLCYYFPMLRLVLAAILLLPPSIAVADVTGHARVLDGDTIEIAGERIRLHGIDAPELKQTCRTKRGKAYDCGRLAVIALRDLIWNQEVTCRGDRRDKDKYLIAKCFIGRIDLGEQIVLTGRAVAYTKDSDDYVRAEEGAKRLKQGLWGGTFMPPWEWRKKQ